MAPHLIERCSPHYVRNGTTTLFAALNTATGRVTARCQPRHRHQEFLVFLRQVARAYPGVDLHLVMGNYATHKHAAVKDWLTANPRIHVHFTPTHAPWMNMVEIFFGIAESQHRVEQVRIAPQDHAGGSWPPTAHRAAPRTRSPTHSAMARKERAPADTAASVSASALARSNRRPSGDGDLAAPTTPERAHTIPARQDRQRLGFPPRRERETIRTRA